ncbi:unnamed protein product (macronuclear) [Paramecium tetraurelia]|uniref:Transmembrane protein n=1 Tax=Paramecium tetraurelia TaxID=5888 RepID=A0BP05_PARTE|nr:uncharacterized protein GSPATT00030911001 [Paramecium tetraurelia]CAK60272.1 unnamed protein product [Paramecium tetraurelia]|eukprot:XP_001427670.1 hypothetical protein (macronuclear) [Paramecium tetraurelia strain d4-2]
MKISQIDQTKLSNQQNGANNQNNKSKQYSSKLIKKSSISIHEENQQEIQFIPELVRLKEQILSTYLKQNRALIGSQNQIVKYLSLIKLEILMKFSQFQSRTSPSENLSIQNSKYQYSSYFKVLVQNYLVLLFFLFSSLKGMSNSQDNILICQV